MRLISYAVGLAALAALDHAGPLLAGLVFCGGFVAGVVTLGMVLGVW